MWASVQTVRGCPKHCSFCSVWRTDGQRPRQRTTDAVLAEIVDLRRRGFRFIALADDNFYPVTLEDLETADRRHDKARYSQLKALRDERFELMEQLAKLPKDTVFFTQITMEASEDPAFLEAMKAAHIKGALVGVESVTKEGLKDVYKPFNAVGDQLVERLRAFRKHDIHVLGSFIFGLPSDSPSTFDATAALAAAADVTFAQFVMLTPFPGTVDFMAWEKTLDPDKDRIAGIPVSRHWLIPQERRPKVYVPHPKMEADEIRARTQAVWDKFYRCTRTPASPPTAHASTARPSGRAGSRVPAAGCSLAGQCRTWRSQNILNSYSSFSLRHSVQARVLAIPGACISWATGGLR
jgi:radical SAM superfamily enzyme YgiQ (UPF0313 family)